ncbi:MAG: FAD-dependent oxidoreductase [Aggregatilineales bacterium]
MSDPIRSAMKFIDDALNTITMYRLVLYYLIGLIGIAIVLCFLGLLPYDPFGLFFSAVFLTFVCWVTNTVFAKTFKVPTNMESAYISALILALIITPLSGFQDLWFLGWAGVWAMASKYILAINGKHLFNPVAFAVALTALTLNQTASWWVGSGPMLAFVLVGGLLIVRKTRRSDLVFTFLGVAVVTTLALTFINRDDLVAALQNIVLYSPLVFFAGVILTEPLTTPPTTKLQIIYGVIVGFLFSPQVHFGLVYITPELSILIGNVFSYIVSPKAKLILKLKEKIQTAPDTYDFIFVPNRKLAFAPGQYMEWTLGHEMPDSRGNRRYFTLASSPTENTMRLGIKFYDRKKSSTFKKALLSMNGTQEIVASQLAGDFVLPDDPKQKCVFIAGGIGITPFRSMIQYLLDMRQKRPITLFYANRSAADIVYKDVFDRAQQQLGIKTIYTLTDTKPHPPTWKGRVGYINAQMIKQEVPDYQKCVFYLSGPNAMIENFDTILSNMGVRRSHIKRDFFPGFA